MVRCQWIQPVVCAGETLYKAERVARFYTTLQDKRREEVTDRIQKDTLKIEMAGLPDESVFKGHKLLTQAGEQVDAEVALGDKTVIAVYFSAHWCPPCRNFTPMLKDFHAELADKPFAIIFVSSDRDEDSMKAYFKNDHGDYYACPFADETLSKALKTNCGVSGIPMLAIVDKKGKMIHGEGRGDVGKGPAAAFKKWEDLSKA